MLVLEQPWNFHSVNLKLESMDTHAGLAFVLLGPGAECDVSRPSHPTTSSSLPSIICFHGSGTTSHYDTWLPLATETSKHAPVLFYERRGVGASPSTSPRSQTAQEAVKDLVDLLRRLDLKPPYILLAHSYGGTFAREFLQQHPDQVAGMVLAETGQETPTKHDEEQYRRQILGDKPLSVIHADSLHDKREGTSTPEGLKLLTRWAVEDERLKKAQLRLSSNARYVRVDGCGHDIVRHRPDIVCEEVTWVLNNLLSQPIARSRSFIEYLRSLVSRPRR